MTIMFDTTPLLESTAAISKTMAAMQAQVLKALTPTYKKVALTWGKEQMKGISAVSFVIDEGTSFEFSGTWTGALAVDLAGDAKPRPVTREEILTSLEKIVGEVGAGYTATSHGTNHPGPDGRRCVQGELMVDLGFTAGNANTYLPGSHDGVSALFCLDSDAVAYSMLEEAESMNDTGEEWGAILTMAKQFFAKAA